MPALCFLSCRSLASCFFLCTMENGCWDHRPNSYLLCSISTCLKVDFPVSIPDCLVQFGQCAHSCSYLWPAREKWQFTIMTFPYYNVGVRHRERGAPARWHKNPVSVHGKSHPFSYHLQAEDCQIDVPKCTSTRKSPGQFKLSIQCLTHHLWPKSLHISPLLFFQSSQASY